MAFFHIGWVKPSCGIRWREGEVAEDPEQERNAAPLALKAISRVPDTPPA